MPFKQSEMQDKVYRQMMMIIIIIMQTIFPLNLGDLKACKLCLKAEAASLKLK